MAMGNGELMHECFPKHSRIGTARMKEDKKRAEERREYGKKVQRARIKSPDGLSLPNQNTILINIKWYYFRTHGKNTMKFN